MPDTPPLTPAPASPAKHPHHHWIFALLLIAIFLMIAIFGIFAYATFFSGDEMQTRNQAELPVITEEQKEALEDMEPEEPIVEPVEVEPLPATLTYEGNFPTFSYPVGWSLTHQITEFNEMLHIAPGPTTFFHASDSPIAPITMRVLPEDAAILAKYETGINPETLEPYPSIIDNFEQTTDGNVIKFTGTYNDEALFSGTSFEDIIFSTSEARYSIEFHDGVWSDVNEGWEIIKASLNLE